MKPTFTKPLTARTGFCGNSVIEIWFLECWRCKRERDYARKMRDLRYIATIKLWQEWSIERQQNFEEGQQLLDLVKYTFF